MSTTIDNRVVQMGFDNSNFEKNVQTSLGTIDKLKQSLNFEGATESFDNITKSAGKVSFGGMESGIQQVQAKFSALEVAAITAIANIVNSAVNAGKNIVNALAIEPITQGYQEYELKMGSIQTIMAGTGASLEEVNGYLDELNLYADKTIYSFSDMTSNIGKFTNAGVKLEDAVLAIKGVSNEAAVSGANAQEASRAMYNFAQALSAGYVKLIDWKSIENANMATVEFKNQLLETALALGTVVEQEGMYVSTTTDANGKVSAAFDATHNFNDALSSQWMTTDVLVQTLSKYADETTEIGKKAYASAQDVKTLTMMFDTLKEAAGSGWAQTWELIVGDFESAKASLTDLTNEISAMLDRSSSKRNELIEKTLYGKNLVDYSDWMSMVNSGNTNMSDLSYLQTILRETAKLEGINVDALIEKNGSFAKSLEEGWLTADLFAKALDNSTEKAGQFTDAELMMQGFTHAEVQAMRSLRKEVGETSTDIGSLVDQLTRKTGREYLVDSILNIVKFANTLSQEFDKVWEKVFPVNVSESIYQFLKSFNEMTAKLLENSDLIDRLSRTFQGLASILDIVRRAFVAVWDGLSPLFNGAGNFAMDILGVSASFGDWAYNLDQTLQEMGVFDKITQTITDTIELLKKGIDPVVEKFKEFAGVMNDKMSGIDSSPLQIVEKIISTLGDKFSQAGDAIGKAFETVANAWKQSGLEGVFQTIFDVIKVILGGVFDVLTYAINGLSDAIGGGNLLNTLLSLINVIVTGSILDKLYSFKKIVEDFGGIFDYIADSFEMLAAKIESEMFKNYAEAILILAAAMMVMASIDAERLDAVCGIVAGLFAGLTVLAAGIDNFVGSTTGNNVPQALSSMFGAFADSTKYAALGNLILKLAASVAILALSMKLLSDIPEDDLLRAGLAIAALLGMMIASVKILSQGGEKMKVGSMQMIAFALAVRILAGALKSLSGLTDDELETGMLALAGCVGIMVVALRQLDAIKWAGATMLATSIGMIALAAALKIFATMEEDEIERGLMAMGFALLELVVALNAMKGVAVVGAASLIIASVGLIAIAGALKLFSMLQPDEIARGLIAMGGALAELAIALVIMQAGLIGATALVVASVGLIALAGALKLLGSLSVGEIVKSLLSLIAVVAVITGLSVVLAVTLPLILAFGVAMALIGVGITLAAAGLLTLSIALTALGTAFAVMGTVITAALVALGESLAKSLISFITTLADGQAQILTAVGGFLVAVIDLLLTLVPKLVELGVTFIITLCDALITTVPKLIETAWTILLAFVTSIRNNIQQLTYLAIDIIAEFINGIARGLPKIIQAGFNLLISFINGLTDAINKNTPVLVNAMKGLFWACVNAIVTILTGGAITDIKDAGKKLMDDGLFKGIKDLFWKLGGIGANIVSGIVDGIVGCLSDVADAGKKIANKALDSIKNVLGIHSPSRAFAEVGEYSIMGLVEGLADKAHSVTNAAEDIGVAALDALSSSIGNMADLVEDNIDTNPVITPVLDLSNIQNGANSLSNMFSREQAIGVSGTFDGGTARAQTQAVEGLRAQLSGLGTTTNNSEMNNVFNITSESDPREIADRISEILQKQVERRDAQWA